jgi:hypothetical protein
MGFRFRKSIKICNGLKINLNNNSASFSIGTKGARYSISSKDRKTATIGIPGTGISYSVSNTNNHKKQINNNYRKPPITKSSAQKILNKGHRLVDVINTTSTPQKFFSSVDEYRLFLSDLTNYYQLDLFKGASPVKQLNSFNNMLPEDIDLFIKRYFEHVNLKIINFKTENSKIKEANMFLQNLEFYSNYMSDSNILLYQNLYNNLIDVHKLNIRKINHIFCIFCGKQITKNSLFCTYCGKKQ